MRLPPHWSLATVFTQRPFDILSRKFVSSLLQAHHRDIVI
jgi:hypothetical protein